MSTKVLICDDSSFARKAIERSIPDGWDVQICFAENGLQAIEKVKAGLADVLFLDLNMPVMDGYQAMQMIKDENLPVVVIVVSGDVQTQAHAKVKTLGAIDFISKPIDNEKLSKTLKNYGLYTGTNLATQRRSADSSATIDPESAKLDAFREMANVAMGQAGEKLAQLLGKFVSLPIPNVNIITNSELHMAIAEVKRNDRVSAVSKGFISSGINGEALVIFNDSDVSNTSKLLNYTHAGHEEGLELEALMDVSNILIGACLNALSDQMHVNFSHNHPIMLGRNSELDEILKMNITRKETILAIEIGYSKKNRDLDFDLLLLFPGRAVDLMFEKLTQSVYAVETA